MTVNVEVKRWWMNLVTEEYIRVLLRQNISEVESITRIDGFP